MLYIVIERKRSVTRGLKTTTDKIICLTIKGWDMIILNLKKNTLSQEWESLLFAIHLHFQGLLSGIFSLLTSKTHQMSNSSKVSIWGGSEIRPHNCIMQCYTDYRKYIMCTKMWIQRHYSTCISYLSVVQSHCHCSMKLYMSYFIDPWFGIETLIRIYSACLSVL